MQCSDFFQPYIDWMFASPAPNTANTVSFLITGNRSEADRFVLFISGFFPNLMNSQFQGSIFEREYFSNRVGANRQPFDLNQADRVNITLTVPNGPLVFMNGHTGNLVAQFSTLECRDNGLLVCTSDFD